MTVWGPAPSLGEEGLCHLSDMSLRIKEQLNFTVVFASLQTVWYHSREQERIINKSIQLPIASVDTALSGTKC